MPQILHQLFSADPHRNALYFACIAGGIIAGLLFIGLLQLLPTQFRRPAIALFTFLGGAFYALEFFLPPHFNIWPHHNFLTPYLPAVGTLVTVLQATAVGLGIINLLQYHLRQLTRVREGWSYSLVLLACFVAMFVWGILNDYSPTGVVIPKLPGLNAPITNEDMYVFLFYGGYANLDSTMFALIGFFIVSASYRAFRIRSAEASLLMAAAVVVMLGQVTLGTAITHTLPLTGLWSNLRMENLALYILNQVNAPAMRGIYFGIGVGFLATSLRLWLNLERGVYFDTE
jgi:hypothetical protein